MFFRMDLRIHNCFLPPVAGFPLMCLCRVCSWYIFIAVRLVAEMDSFSLIDVRHHTFSNTNFLLITSPPLLIPDVPSINGMRRNSYLLHDMLLVKYVTSCIRQVFHVRKKACLYCL